MRKTKRIISFLITFSLLLSMAPFAFATNAELTEVKVYHLTLPVDTDTVARANDQLDPNTWHPVSTNDGLPGNHGNFDKIMSEDGVTFNFVGKEGGVLDSIGRFTQNKAKHDYEKEPKTVQASGRPASKLYFAHNSRSSSSALPVSINYTDGTTDTKTLKLPGVYYATTKKIALGLNGIYIDTQTNKAKSQTNYDNSHLGIVVTGLDLAEGKIVESYTLGTTQNASLVILGMSEKPLTNEELLAGVNVDLDNATDDEIRFAKECAKELNTYRNDLTDYSAITNEYNDRLLYLTEVAGAQLNLASSFNADFIGYTGETVDFNTWLLGASQTGWDNFGGLEGSTACLQEGAISVNGVTFDIDPETLHAKTLDAVSFKNNPTIKVESSGRPANDLYILYMSEGSENTVNFTVNYEDGTSDNFTHAFPCLTYSTATGFGDIVKKIERPMGYYKAIADSETNIISVKESGEHDLIVMKINIPKDKIVDNYSINASSSSLAFFGISEVLLSNAELLTTIKDLSTDDKVIFAKACVDELVLRGADRSSFKDIDNAYTELQASKDVYIDIAASGLTADVIVPNNSSILKSEYKGREDDYVNEDGEFEGVGNNNVYDASTMPANGIITMDPPTDQTIPDEPTIVPGYNGKTLTAATFKLSGDYKGFGEDAILVDREDADGVTINFSEAEQRKYKDMYFLLDSPRGEQILTYGVKVKINFEDGTSIDANSRLHYNRSFYNPYTYAHKNLGYTALQFTEGKDENGEDNLTSRISDGDSIKLFASGLIQKKITDETTGAVTFKDIEIPYKDVTSITFMPESRVNYTILAVTAVPYTTLELEEKYWNAYTAYDDADRVITVGENDDEIKMGAEAGIELYEDRKAYDCIDEELYAVALEMLEAVEKARQLSNLGFETQLSIAVADGKVTATAIITNGVIDDSKDIVLVVAAYGENNKLLSLNATPGETFGPGTDMQERKITCDDHEDAVYYAAFAWESLNSLRPISYTTQPK